MLLERCQFWLVSGSNKQSFSFLFLVKVKLLKGLLCLLSTQLTNFIKHYFKLQGWINCLFSCHVWGFDLLRNQQGAACWRHTILLHLGPRILFSVPEIKQEYFHINRYPTIPSVVYITTILLVVCICLITSQRAEQRPTLPPLQAWHRALPSMHVNVPLSTPVNSDHFHLFISQCRFMCIVGSENMLLS